MLALINGLGVAVPAEGEQRDSTSDVAVPVGGAHDDKTGEVGPVGGQAEHAGPAAGGTAGEVSKIGTVVDLKKGSEGVARQSKGVRSTTSSSGPRSASKDKVGKTMWLKGEEGPSHGRSRKAPGGPQDWKGEDCLC